MSTLDASETGVGVHNSLVNPLLPRRRNLRTYLLSLHVLSSKVLQCGMWRNEPVNNAAKYCTPLTFRFDNSLEGLRSSITKR